MMTMILTNELTELYALWILANGRTPRYSIPLFTIYTNVSNTDFIMFKLDSIE